MSSCPPSTVHSADNLYRYHYYNTKTSKTFILAKVLGLARRDLLLDLNIDIQWKGPVRPGPAGAGEVEDQAGGAMLANDSIQRITS